MVIHVVCRTNLDEYRKEKWPEVLYCRPMIGEKVIAVSGKRLKIVGITHGIDYLEIELGKIL